jgi:hypothetical protein
MSRRYDKSVLDAIRDRTNCVDLLAPHVDLNLAGGVHVGRCVFHQEKTGSLHVWDDHAHCFGCGFHGDAVEIARKLGKLTFVEAVERLLRAAGIDRQLAPEERAELERQRQAREHRDAEIAAWKLRLAKRIISESVASAGSGVMTYLAARNIVVCQVLDDILFHPNLPQSEPDPNRPKRMIEVARWPAMIGVVRDRAGEIVGCHRVYLAHDCTAKAPIDRPKRMLGDCVGAAVRLGPPAEEMIGCEGIETGAALIGETGISTWAGLSTSGLAALELPDLPMGQDVIAAADNDENGAGEHAARKAVARWITQGRRVRFAMPDQVDTDFADVSGITVVGVAA